MMIVYKDNQSQNFYTEGFGVSNPEPFLIKVDAGSLCYLRDEKLEEIHYPEFEFVVEPDSEVPVIYDIHLLDIDSATPIHIDRTEITEDTFAFYSGELELQHTIITFMVLPSVTSLNDVEITVNNVLVVKPVENSGE